jgi:hypothetical protein
MFVTSFVVQVRTCVILVVLARRCVMYDAFTISNLLIGVKQSKGVILFVKGNTLVGDGRTWVKVALCVGADVFFLVKKKKESRSISWDSSSRMDG